MTEGPYKLPKGWRWVRLGEVCQHRTGIWGPEASDPAQGFPIVRSTEIDGFFIRPQAASVRVVRPGRVDAYKLETGDILVSKSSGSPHLVGWPAIFENPQDGRIYLFSNFMLRLRSDRRSLEPWFLLYYLHSPIARSIYLGAQDTTSGLRNLRVREFMAQPIPLPPLEEQRRIVARIEELMARVREARRLREQAREDAERLWQAVLAETFPRPGSDLPAGWRWVRLGEVCEIVMGQSPPGRTYNNEAKGLPFFQGKADFGELYPVPRVWCNAPQKIAKPGDILISVRAPVGPTNIARETCCIGRGLAALRVIHPIETMWLLYYLRSIEAELSKTGSGSTFNAITKRELQALAVPLPPLAEQRRIVAHLERVQEKVKVLKEAQAAIDAQLQRLEQSILDKAFRGEL